MELLKQGAVLTQSSADILGEFGWEQDAPRSAPALPTGFAGELAALIRDRGEALLDDLIVETGKSAPELLVTLMTLELQGIVRTLPSGRYTV